jgi:hypothetical protein
MVTPPFAHPRGPGAAICVAITTACAAAGRDRRGSSHDPSAIQVTSTRTGDDVSWSLSAAQTNRVNGGLAGDTVELARHRDQSVLTRRPRPAGDRDYTRAIQQIRDREQRRQPIAKTALPRMRRADLIALTHVATTHQKALSPSSSDDPSHNAVSQLKPNGHGLGFGSGRSTRTNAIRDSDAALRNAVSRRASVVERKS